MARQSRSRSSHRKSPRASRTGQVRIIGGQWRSRLLPVPDRPGLRPTPSRVRETLFNWLAPILPGARCLDLFAGTGILGIEALSRGAGHVEFVDQDRQAGRAIEQALDTLQGRDQARVVEADACHPPNRLTPGSVDLAFIDPPFEQQLHARALAAVTPLLKPQALVYLEYPLGESQAMQALLAEHYEIVKQSKAGESGFGLVCPTHAQGTH